MGQYNFVSPFAAAGNALVDTLTQRRDEERQRLIDEIAQKNAEVERRTREEAIKASEHRRLEDEVDSVTEGLSRNQDLSGLDPKFLEALKKRGRVGTRTKDQPKVETSAMFAVPDSMGDFVTMPDTPTLPGAISPEGQVAEAPKPEHSNYYLGTPEEQRQERIRGNIGQVLGSMNDPNMTAMDKMIAFYQALETDNTPAGIWQMFEDPQEMSIYDMATGKLEAANDPVTGKRLTTRGNDAVIERSRPPQAPQPQAFSVPDGQGGFNWVWRRPGEEIPTGARKGNQPVPRPTPATKPILTDGTQKNLAKLKGTAQQTGSDDDWDKYWFAADNALESATVLDESIREAVRQVMAAGEGEPRTAEDIAEEMSQDPESNPAEIFQFIRLLRMLRGY